MTTFNYQNAADSDGNSMDASGFDAYQAVAGFAGATLAAAKPRRIGVTAPWIKRVNYLPAGNTVLTMAMLPLGIITSSAQVTTSLLVPTMATLGWTFNQNAQLYFVVQRDSVGVFAVNFASGVTINNPNNLDPVNMPAGSPPIRVVMYAADTWRYE